MVSLSPTHSRSSPLLNLTSQGHAGKKIEVQVSVQCHSHRDLDLNTYESRHLHLILGFLTKLFCITLRCQGQCHGGNDLGLVGARHLYLNFGDL